MDRAFLDYYEEELTHVRALASEFAAMHPAVARNLSLDTVPCPDPYVERLLDGVAFLAARTRLKLDAERTRFARAVLDQLYPDLVAPTPAMGIAVLRPGKQVETMLAGHVVKAGTRLVSALRPGLASRSTYTTVQDVTLWPVEIREVGYLQDRSALAAGGLASPRRGEAVAGLRVKIGRVGKGALSDLSLERLDVTVRDRAKGAMVFDGVFGATLGVIGRPDGKGAPADELARPEMIGIRDDEALLARTRPAFEGYRLIREYFAMPERFHAVRFPGLRPVVRRAGETMEIVVLLSRPVPDFATLTPADLELFATPIVNLFEHDCNVVDIDPRRTRQVLHADRTRPRDFEIQRVLTVEDVESDGVEADVPPLFGLGQNRGSGWVFHAERRLRRPGEDERRLGQTRTSYPGDDVFLSFSRPMGRPAGKPLRRVTVRALCSNRDLPILDDTPDLTLETGDPVDAVRLIGSVRPPRPGLPVAAPAGVASETRADEVAWRMVAQLSLNFLSLAEEGRGADPLHALLDLYADRGDPSLSRHVRSIVRVEAKPVLERLPIPGPVCYGRGTEVVLHVDQSVLAGHSALLLSALLSRLFARYAAINAVVRTRTRLVQKQEDVPWPMTPGARGLI